MSNTTIPKPADDQPRPPVIPEYARANFATLRKACQNGDLALVSCIRKADNKPVSLVCAMSRVGSGYHMSPLAMMLDDENVFDAYISPAEPPNAEPELQPRRLRKNSTR